VKESGEGVSGVENDLDAAEDLLAAITLRGADDAELAETSDAGWNILLSPSILDYSLAVLHGHG
jgi:hypothetical protein